MDKVIAEKTALIGQQVSMILDSHLGDIQDSVETNEFKELCQKVGKVMGEVYFQLLDPIWKEHPELLPEKMGGNYKINESMYKELYEVIQKHVNHRS